MDYRCGAHTTAMCDVGIGKRERNDGRPNEQTRSRGKQDHNGHEQPKTVANGADTHNIRRTKVTSAPGNKQEEATPVYLTMQEQTYNTEVKLYYMIQVSM